MPVNAAGERVHDETVNRLTVIANESYEDFARTLQTEFEEDFGIQFGKVEKIAFARLLRRSRRRHGNQIGQDASVRIWDELVDERLSHPDRRILREPSIRRIRISN